MGLNLSGLDDMMASIAGLIGSCDQVAKDMLDAGEAEVIAAWQQVSPVRTGAMRGSVKGHRKGGSAMTSEVYPDGSDHGVRNAEKAFILHYGTKRIPGSHWVDQAEEIAEPAATAAMEEIFNQYIGSGG